MFRALYPFASSDPGALKASVDDLYCGMGFDASKLWMQVMNDKGTVGYLPNNFLEFCNWARYCFEDTWVRCCLGSLTSLGYKFRHITPTTRLILADQKFILQFLDGGVGNIHQLATADGKYTALQQEQLRLLSLHRATVTNNVEQFITHMKDRSPSNAQKSKSIKTRQAPPPPKRANESTSTSELSNQRVSKDHMTQSDSTDTVTRDKPRSSSNVKLTPPDVIATKLTELLRFKTGLSHEKSKIGVTAILECLMAHNVSPEQLPNICQAVDQDAAQSAGDGELNHDIVEMNSIFESITECKDDSQQRSWHLHDDESFIAGKLTRLLEILTSGNRDVLVSSIRKDLDCVHNLVLYYQMETRSTLRAIMLQIFAALCAMSAVFITTLLCSVLTMELVGDLMSTKDEQRLTYSAIVLSMLFSTGENIPVNYNEFLSDAFVDFIVEKIEQCTDLRIVSVCLELLLSFNQHFADPHENTVLQQLAKQPEATVLTQNFLKLFNEGEDPVKVIPNDEQMSSVLKFAIDLYSLESTAQLLYTNDVKVLIDIIIRQLTDLSDEDKVRTEYLSLMQLILANSDYEDHCHRKQDLVAALNQIEFIEEATSSQYEMDVNIVREIRKHL